MTDMNFDQQHLYLKLSVEVVAAYVGNNPVPASELPRLILKVHDAMIRLTTGSVLHATDQPVEDDKPTPAQIRRSVQHDGIVSFIDGKTYKTLKRHLTANGFSPQDYRERYGLPTDYPMVAPSYAERRSALAKAIGLGQPTVMAGRGRRASEAA